MKILITCLVFLFSLSVHAQEGMSVDVKPGQTEFTVSLDANPTTGYQWKLVSMDKKLIKLTQSTYQHPKINLIGAGGQMRFTFTLNKVKTYPASSDIVFQYARSWEPKGGTMKKVRVNFLKS